jgi:AraC-like DNA-binding protein
MGELCQAERTFGHSGYENSGTLKLEQTEPSQTDSSQTESQQENLQEWRWEDLSPELREAVRFSDRSFQERLLEYFREQAEQAEQAEQISAEPEEQQVAGEEQSLAKPEELAWTPMPHTSTRTILRMLSRPDRLDYMELASVIYDFTTMYSHYKEGLETIRAVYQQYEPQMDRNTRLEYRNMEADLLSFDRQYIESYALSKEIHPLIENEDLKARNLYNLGFVAGEHGQYNEAASYLFEAAEIFQALDQNDKVAMTYNQIGLLYLSMNEFETAYEYLQKYITVAESLADSTQMITANINMGITLKEEGRDKEAIVAYQEAYDLALQMQLPSKIAQIEMNIGNIYTEMEEYDQAMVYYKRSLAVCEEIGLEYGVILNKFNIGSILSKTGDDRGAETNLLLAYEYFKNNQIQNELSIVTEHLMRVYQNLGEPEKSIQFMNEHFDLRNKLYDIEKTELTEDLRFRYETDLKDQQILLSEAEIREKEATNRALILLSICLVGSVGYYRHRNRYLRMLYERNVELLDAIGMNEWRKKTKAETSVQTSEDKRNEELFEKLEKLMREEELYKDPELQVSKLCRQLGSNERYLSQAVNSMTGMHYNNYINQYRINEAKRLILLGEDSITDIQFVIGFQAKSTFYTAFRKSTGMTPTQFLEQHRQVTK